MWNYDKLRGKIKEKYGSQDKFAEKMKIGRVSLSQRLTGKLEFSQNEMNRAIELLELEKSEIPIYFFTPKVQKTEQTA